MASNGAEDFHAQAFGPGLAARLLAGSGSPTSLTRTVSYTQSPRDHVDQLHARVAQNRQNSVSGTLAHRACLPLSSASPKTARGKEGLNSNASSSNGRVSGVAPHASPSSSVSFTSSKNSIWQSASKNSCRSSARFDSLQLRPGLLSKRTLASHRAIYPTCQSLPKATSRKSSVVIEGTLPTDRSLPWSCTKLGASRRRSGGATPRTTASLTSQSGQEPSEPRSSFNPSQVALRCYTDDKGARQIERVLAHPAVPSQSRCQDSTQEHSSGDKELQKLGGMVRADAGLEEHPLQCHGTYEGAKGQVGAALERLGESGSLLRNGAANGLAMPPGSDTDPPCIVEAVNTDSGPRSSANHVPPAKSAPLCLAGGDETTCCVPDEVCDAPGDSVRKGACLKPLSVYSLTNQISAMHLTKESRPLPQLSELSYSLPPLEDHSAMGLRLLNEETLSMSLDEVEVEVEEEEEEELADEMEGHCSGDDNDGFDCSSVDNFSSATSTGVSSNIEDPDTPVLEEDVVLKPALVPSLFPHTPPTLYFGTAKERVEMLPDEQRKLLKWKMSSVTPNVVKHTVARSHFKATKRSHEWLGCWGHHMKSPGFRSIREYQKLNHFPGSFQIGRKDRLWRNLSKMQVHFGKQEFGFFPRSFVLPQDMKLLRKAWDSTGTRQKWIIKPPASARGIGIQVIHKWSQLPNRRPLLVQKYLHKPYLISGNKFDLRIYVYVTCYDPLRVYIFTDGLVRFASCKYSSSLKSLSNKFMHLTNYSVNKKNSEYQSNSDDKACQGHKWALKALWHYLGSRGVNTNLIWEKIKDIVIKTIIAADPYVNTLVKMHVRSPYSCHELFGFDIMLDEHLWPWLLEVNISPSLHSNTALDASIKGQMMRDLMNLAGFVLPQREDLVPLRGGSLSSSASSLAGGDREKSRHGADMLFDEKLKRAHFLSQCQRSANPAFYSTVLDALTPRDVRVLRETEDELTRRGHFERVFPSAVSSHYLRFFEQPRYLNILLNQWEAKYCNNRGKGINLLRGLCRRGVHLGNASDAVHPTQWLVLSVSSQKVDSCNSLSIKAEPIRSSVVVSLTRGSQHDEEDPPSAVSSPPDTGASTPMGCSSLSNESLPTGDLS
ncbi:tubulin polyglutamylase TTLL4 [Conger conger]|uniref:tubulin polyglutamylase TTLL4 n=1 Tax=Conger conger TaxID=82655 RepID=UPI002A5B0D19|nr:tubulin polyglutamylase TTLL4 [Conger conger]